MSSKIASPFQHILDRITKRTATIGVVGLGYVGLPFLVEKMKAGFKVVGIDQNPERAEMVARGENYIGDVNDEVLREGVERGLIAATTSLDVVGELDVVVICVPTPLTNNLTPDLQYVESVALEIAQNLRPGQLISLEVATRFYGQTIEHLVPVSSAKAAELVKVYENTFRAVNIALANEVALLCDLMELNVWEVLDAAFTKPFGIMPFYPGPGVGGHCIPLDPHYLEWKAREYNFQTHFIALAGETNRKMPEFVVDKAARVLNQVRKPLNGSKILLLGMAYKADLNDYRGSPAIEL